MVDTRNITNSCTFKTRAKETDGRTQCNEAVTKHLMMIKNSNCQLYFCRSDVYASQRWYYWKAKPEQVTAITKMFPWLCYSVHMLSVWLVLYLQHKAKVSNMCVGPCKPGTRSLYGKRLLENTSVMLFSSFLYLSYIGTSSPISLMIKNPADKLKSHKD